MTDEIKNISNAGVSNSNSGGLGGGEYSGASQVKVNFATPDSAKPALSVTSKEAALKIPAAVNVVAGGSSQKSPSGLTIVGSELGAPKSASNKSATSKTVSKVGVPKVAKAAVAKSNISSAKKLPSVSAIKSSVGNSVAGSSSKSLDLSSATSSLFSLYPSNLNKGNHTMANQSFDQISQTINNGLADLNEAQKESMEAFAKSCTLAAKCTETLTQSYVSFCQSAFDSCINASKALMGAKTLKEVSDIQNAYVKKAFETAVSESSKISELSVKAANDISQPLTQQFASITKKAAKASKAA